MVSLNILVSIFVFFLGSVLASFSGVVSERLGTGQSFVTGRSRCNACNRYLTGWDLFPVVSFVFQRGRCRMCSAKITYTYFLSEVVLGTVFVLEYLFFALTPVLPLVYLFTFLLMIVVLYDLRHTIVPFKLSLSLVVLGGVIAFIRTDSLTTFGVVCMEAGLIALFFYLLHVLSRGRWMGLGDTPIALSLSLFITTQAIAGLLFSFWAGALVGIVILVSTPASSRMGIEVPFVPFLAFGYLLALFSQWNPLLFF